MTKSSKPKFFYGYVIVVAAFVIMAIAYGGAHSYGVFFEPMTTEFGWTRAMTSGAFSTFVLLSGLLAVGVGRLNDKFGPRVVLTGGSVLFGLGYLLMSRVSTIWQLYLFFGVIMGVGVGSYIVPLLSTVAKWFDKRRGMMSGIVGAGEGTGTMAMPLLVGWLISSYGWRNAFIVIGVIVLVIIVFAAQFFRRDPQSKGQLPDGETEVKQEGSNLEAGGLSFRQAIRTRQFWMIWTIILCLGFSFFTILVHIVINATGLGIPIANAVNVLAVIGGVSIVGKIALGSAADRIGNRPILIISLSLLSAALFGLLVAKEMWMLYLFATIFGFASGVYVLWSPLVAELFGLRSHGTLFGFIDAGFTIGGSLGPFLVGYIFDVTSSYQLGFLTCGMVSVVGLILAWLLKSPGSEKGEISQS